MIEEPYRWVEAIANRREYIEHQLASGSPIAALSFDAGVLLLTMGKERQKLYEIHDRIAMGAIGHPGDIERLRMAAIEVAGTEGFARSSQDVSLRRLTSYALSPALKAAFEQVYGAPYLARMLFAEVGRGGQPDMFLRLEFDGSIHAGGGAPGVEFRHSRFGVLSGTGTSAGLMERYLAGKVTGRESLEEALALGLDCWVVGYIGLEQGDIMPSAKDIEDQRGEQLGRLSIEVAVMQRESPLAMTWRSMRDADVRELLHIR